MRLEKAPATPLSSKAVKNLLSILGLLLALFVAGDSFGCANRLASEEEEALFYQKRTLEFCPPEKRHAEEVRVVGNRGDFQDFLTFRRAFSIYEVEGFSRPILLLTYPKTERQGSAHALIDGALRARLDELGIRANCRMVHKGYFSIQEDEVVLSDLSGIAVYSPMAQGRYPRLHPTVPVIQEIVRQKTGSLIGVVSAGDYLPNLFGKH